MVYFFYHRPSIRHSAGLGGPFVLRPCGVPELPDIEIYIEALSERVVGQPVAGVRLSSPFLVRSVEPPLATIVGKRVVGLRRLGKRIVFELDQELFLVLHLMISGRLHYLERGAAIPRKRGLCAFDFSAATLLLTEASSKRRASLHLVRGEAALGELDPGGMDVLGCSLEQFRRALLRENHTLKRTMTDPRLLSGIGNAYSDEILHHAQLSPVKWTTRLKDDEIERLFHSTRQVLERWTERLRAERGSDFPTRVTAFRSEMAVHGKYNQPCPACSTKVQRIVRGRSEVNYCPQCQTGGKLLADRALSKLLRGDWPKTLEQLDERKDGMRTNAQLPPTTGAGGRASSRKPKPPSADARSADAPASITRSTKRRRPLLLFAHGAGASSGSDWMVGWSERLREVGDVVTFDYPYMKAGRRRPDGRTKLLAAHLAALQDAQIGHDGPVVLIGKSMGSRMGCHLALEHPVDALVCLGYPLVSAGKSRALRDQVLVDTTAPILFVQGTRDRLCPLDTLETVRAKMRCPNQLHIVDAGDHSLRATKTWLKQNGKTQDDVDELALEAVAAFVTKHVC